MALRPTVDLQAASAIGAAVNKTIKSAKLMKKAAPSKNKVAKGAAEPSAPKRGRTSRAKTEKSSKVRAEKNSGQQWNNPGGYTSNPKTGEPMAKPLPPAVKLD